MDRFFFCHFCKSKDRDIAGRVVAYGILNGFDGAIKVVRVNENQIRGWASSLSIDGKMILQMVLFLFAFSVNSVHVCAINCQFFERVLCCHTCMFSNNVLFTKETMSEENSWLTKADQFDDFLA